MPFEFSPRQQRAIVAALTILSLCVILAATGALVYLISLFLAAFSSVFLPLAVAGVLALVVKPYYDWLNVGRGLPRALAVFVVFLSLLLPVALVLGVFGAVIAAQVQDLISRLPEWWQSVRAWVEERMPEAVALWERWGVGQRLRALLEGEGQALVSSLQSVGGQAVSAGALVIQGIGELLSWAVLPVYFAFFLMMRTPDRVRQSVLPFLKPETRDDVVYLAREFVNMVVAFFRGQLIVAFLQGVLFAVGFSIVGLRYGFILGLLLGFLNIVPYLGSIVGLAICLPLALFQEGGGWVTLGLVVLVFTIVQLIEGYLLTPKIMGDRTGLHPMAVIVSIFFWGAALNGILGMILAIPLTAFLVVFWRLARDKYIEEWV